MVEGYEPGGGGERRRLKTVNRICLNGQLHHLFHEGGQGHNGEPCNKAVTLGGGGGGAGGGVLGRGGGGGVGGVGHQQRPYPNPLVKVKK